MSAQPIDWDGYLAAFHARSPGITEQVLTRCHAGGSSPYDWLLDGIDATGRIVDLGCGSGPARPAGAQRWVGIDRSVGELRAARKAGRGALVLGDATGLPIGEGVVDTVVCSMSLMLVRPLDEALREIRRVLRHDGELRLLLPALCSAHRDGPSGATRSSSGRRARRRSSRRRRSARRAGAVLETHGLRVESDEARRFAHRVAEPVDADRFVDSWYLPGVSPDRQAAARRRARAMVPVDIGVPLRRVIARRVGMPRATSGVPRP